MKKINLDTVLKMLDGTSVTQPNGTGELTVGQALAYIVLGNKADTLRSYVLAQTLYKGGEMELNKSDLDYVTTSLKTTQTYQPLVTGQIQVILNDTPEA
jgi:hypothetical protein